MKKQILSAALALLILFTLIPTVAFATTEIDTIIFKDIVLPLPGEKPDASWTFVEPDAFTMISAPQWCGAGYVPLADTDTFEAGKTYYFRCVVNTKTGYQFNTMNLDIDAELRDAANNYIKLESILIENDAQGKKVTLGVTCQEPTTVDTIVISNAVLPVPGEHPDAAGKLDDNMFYFAETPFWCGAGYKPLTMTDAFEEGKTYYYRCIVNVKPGYKFTPINLNIDAELRDDADNYIKLESILIENDELGKKVTLGVTCAALTEMDTITFKDVVLPVAGEKPDNTWAFENGDAFYAVKDPVWCEVKDGKYVQVKMDETFEAGRIYYFRGIVNVKPGYKFIQMNISIDGELKDAAGNSLNLESIKIEGDPQGKLVTLGVICTDNSFMLGDVNFDGKITAADARLALRRAVNLETYAAGSKEFKACDVDKNSKITAADARRILRAAVSLEDPKTW